MNFLMKSEHQNGTKIFDLENQLDRFYSDVPVKIWKKILGQDLHYHSALANDIGVNPMEYAIMEMYKYIDPNSHILDCGCGWGAPARQIMRDLKCTVTGVTISKSQFEYIKDFEVIYSDLHDLKLNKFYDIALFVESYCHLNNPKTVLKNLNSHVNKLVIRDYMNTEGDFVKYDSRWKMFLPHKNKYIQQIESSGFIIKEFLDRPHNYMPEAAYWANNLLTLDSGELIGQAKLLYDSCNQCLLSQGSDADSGVSVCTIYAERA